jgi:hypothetical protein
VALPVAGDPLMDAVELHGAHDLRHTFSTWLEDGGIPARVIDELMGHQASSRGGHLRGSAIGAHYRHTTPELAGRVLEAIQQRLTVVLGVAELVVERHPNRLTAASLRSTAVVRSRGGSGGVGRRLGGPIGPGGDADAVPGPIGERPVLLALPDDTTARGERRRQPSLDVVACDRYVDVHRVPRRLGLVELLHQTVDPCPSGSTPASSPIGA